MVTVRRATPADAPTVVEFSQRLAETWRIDPPDLVHAHFWMSGLASVLAGRIADVPVVQTCGLIFASAYVGLNMVADLLGILSNPRLRYPK